MAAPDKMRGLARMKATATSALVAVAVLLVLARSQGWSWIGAFAEAALIGALADWFAVVALFRHPLGLPIPHTAILPRNKARLAENLAEFIRERFLDTASLVARLRAAAPADRLAAWLRQPLNADLLAGRLLVVFAQSVDFMDDPRVRRLFLHAVRRRASGVDIADGLGRLLDAMTEHGRHQALLDEGLRRVSQWLDEPEVRQGFAGMIVDVAGREYPKVVATLGLVGINPTELGERVSAGILCTAALITRIGFVLACALCFTLAVRGFKSAEGRLDLSAKAWIIDLLFGMAIAAPVYWMFGQLLAISLPGLTDTGWI